MFSLILALPEHISPLIVLLLSPIGIFLTFVLPGIMYLRLGPVDADFGSAPVFKDKVGNWILAWLAIFAGGIGIAVDLYCIVSLFL